VLCSYFTCEAVNMNVAEVYTTETANIANNPWVNNMQVNSWFCTNCKVPIFRLVSCHSMWHAGRAIQTSWSVYSEQMQMSIFRQTWGKVICHTSESFKP